MDEKFNWNRSSYIVLTLFNRFEFFNLIYSIQLQESPSNTDGLIETVNIGFYNIIMLVTSKNDNSNDFNLTHKGKEKQTRNVSKVYNAVKKNNN